MSARTHVIKAYLHLAILVAGLELLAVGVWFVLEGIRVRQSSALMVTYVTVAAVVATLVWFGGYRPRRADDTAPRGGTTLGETLLRLDRMDPARLAEHVAALAERDGLADITTVRVSDDGYAVDVHARRADGRQVVARCRVADGAEGVPGGVVEEFAADTPGGEAVRLLATTSGGFSAKARSVAEGVEVTLLDRRAIARWDAENDTPAVLTPAD